MMPSHTIPGRGLPHAVDSRIVGGVQKHHLVNPRSEILQREQVGDEEGKRERDVVF